MWKTENVNSGNEVKAEDDESVDLAGPRSGSGDGVGIVQHLVMPPSLDRSTQVPRLGSGSFVAPCETATFLY